MNLILSQLKWDNGNKTETSVSFYGLGIIVGIIRFYKTSVVSMTGNVCYRLTFHMTSDQLPGTMNRAFRTSLHPSGFANHRSHTTRHDTQAYEGSKRSSNDGYTGQTHLTNH